MSPFLSSQLITPTHRAFECIILGPASCKTSQVWVGALRSQLFGEETSWRGKGSWQAWLPTRVEVHSACQLADILKPASASRDQADAVSGGTYPRPGILFASVRLSYPQDEQKSDDTTLDLARQRVLVSGHGVMSSATSVPRTLELETADRPLWERSTVAPKTRHRGPAVEEYQGISASEGFNKVFLHGESTT
ncbi:hypothetical protein CCHR01_01628 [Colletotrichum chrysophilum]|uniref:Uncharacterized protein n=1 Tax=Colletotrichum chrysophilum TaxID=1836956 RepID=A0AAD9AYA6_9PEZI|nr:hypothetical protein CCHR01_01628 [Colletotrichum chrysophilum]